MFKATFVKIKKACVITLVPRIVRGDGRYTTKKFGKSSINVLRKAGKSTDSGSKDGESDCDKCKRFIELVFGPSKPKANSQVIKENKTTVTNIQELNKDDTIQSAAKIDSSNEKNKVLRDYFGVDEDVVRYNNYDKNIQLQTSVVDKEETLAQNKSNLSKSLNTIKNIFIQSPEKDINLNHKLSSETRNENFENNTHAEDCEQTNKRSNPVSTEFPNNIPANDYKLQATTAKEDKERLEQKIEDIDEAPQVEASKVEGFNIPPKILGDRLANFSDSANVKSKSDYHASLDEIAEKCMNVPSDQIDNKLLQEMEKVGITHRDPQKSIMNEDGDQMDRLKKPEKPLHEVEIDLDKRENIREPIHCAESEKLCPSLELPPHLDKIGANTEDLTETACCNKLGMNEESTSNRGETKKTTTVIAAQAYVQSTADLDDSRPQFDINKPIIDPYDKKCIAFDHDELDEAMMDSKLLDDQRIGKPSQNQNSRDQTFAESYLASSGTVPLSELHSDQTKEQKDSTRLDHVQPVYDSAARELNWKLFPSFEAREEVVDFHNTDRDENISSLSFTDAQTTHHSELSCEPETQHVQSYEPQISHIYTSTHVPSEPREQISHSFVQPEAMINPLMDKCVEKTVNEPKEVDKQQDYEDENVPDAFESLPSLNPDGNVPLTELLRRVRMRNRLEYCREFAIHTLNIHAPETLPAEGKCGKKSPQCPPSPPKCPPPSPCPPRPPACPPPPPPCPKPCKPACPPKKNPCNKFKKKCSGPSIREVLTLLAQTNSQMKIPQKYLLPMFVYKTINTPEPAANVNSLIDDSLVFRLSVLGKILLFHCTEAVDAELPKNRSEVSFSRDFEPWTPIPSWPIPKKEEKQRFVCPKEGCKVIPPPRLNAPCKENPCLNFPKRSNFSLTDLFSFSLVESLVYKPA